MMLFDTIFNNPKWHGKDDFPSCDAWKNEINKWLVFIQEKGELERYKPRLNSKATLRDEALDEILSAYIMENILHYLITDWERKTTGGKDVDFVISDRLNEIYCEVKSPGWEAELSQNERLSGRKNQPKYINAETRLIAPWQHIRYAIKKAYPKFLPNCKNALVLKDDLSVNILDMPLNIEIALFAKSESYDGEKGYFAGADFENIGGILFLGCRLTNEIEYRFKFVVNENAIYPISI